MKRMQRKKAGALFLAASIAVLSGFGGTGILAGAANADDQSLTVSISVDLTDLNPLTESTAEGSELLMSMMETLVRQGEDASLEEGSGLAESWDVSDDMKTYTFHLREAYFSDGTPITAQDFVYTWKKVLDPATASEYAYMLYPIVGAEEYNIGEGSADDVAITAVDDLTLQVELTSGIDYFIGMLVIPQYSVIPEGCVEEFGDKFWTSPEYMVFSGPFMMTDWVSDQSITVEKNPNYWDADSVQLEKIVFDMNTETSTIINMYETDQIDMMLVQSDYLDMYRDADGFVSVTEPVTEYVMFNMDDEFFSNLKIRQAFSMALNRVSYLEDYLKTGSAPAYGYIPNGVSGSDGNDFRDNNGDLYTDLGNGATEEEVNALLDEGLEEIGKTREDLSAYLSLVIGEGDTNLKTAQIFQEQWKNVLGVDLEVKSLSYAMRQDEYASETWTLGKEGWGADYNDALSFLEIFTSDSPYNKTNYASEEFDALIAESTELHGDERLEVLQEAEKILIEQDCVIAPTFFQTRSWVSKDNVKGVIRNGVGVRCDYKYAYIE